MTKFFLLFSLTILVVTAHAQQGKATYITVYGGYGTETNIGFPGAFAGGGVQRQFRKVQVEAKAIYFDANDNEQLYTNSKEDYKALFLTPSVGWHVIGTNQTFFRTTLSAGPSLKWYNIKETNNNVRQPGNPNSLVEPIQYDIEKGTNISLYSALDFSFTVSPKVQAALFLDTYSHEIFLEHFMPGLKLNIRL